MGIADLIFGGPIKVQIGKLIPPTVGLIEFDCSVSETHTAECEVTDHPVEMVAGVGAVMTDHIRALPESIEINGLVTNTPLVYLASLLAKSPVKPSVGIVPGRDRVNEAYLKLHELKNKGVLVDVVTSLRGYQNMAITSIVITRDASTGNVLNCTVGLREVKTATSLAFDLPIPDDVANNAKKEQAKKDKQKSKPKEKEKAGNTSNIMAAGKAFFGA